MTQGLWQATTDNRMLKARAEMLAQIRTFFHARNVLEVDTPILSASAGTEPSLDPVKCLVHATSACEETFFLQTSPEFAMKRLLASGSGAIYQLAKSFRNGELGKKHNPEFTMLEWYRPGFSLSELMDEVEDLASLILGLEKPERLTYRDLFLRHLDLDPFSISMKSLQAIAREKVDIRLNSNNPDHWLDLLFSHCIEPGLQSPVFINDYPPSQAALAEVETDEHGRLVARRFELVVKGMELANGYQELTDPHEQRRRFINDLAQREAEGCVQYPIDENFLAALEAGLPDCAGVALGIDRLLMLKVDADDIRDVISFPFDIA